MSATAGPGFLASLNLGTLGDALTTGTLAQFSSTTSAQLRGVLSDETGSGAAVFGTNPTITNYTESVVAIGNTGTAKTIDLTSGTVQTATLTGNCTFTMPTAAAGKSFLLALSTGAGSFTATFTGVKWPAATAPTVTTAASKVDLFTFVCFDGTNWYGSVVQAFA